MSKTTEQITFYLDLLQEDFVVANRRLGGSHYAYKPGDLSAAERRQLCDALRRRCKKLLGDRWEEEWKVRQVAARREAYKQSKHMRPEEQRVREAQTRRVATTNSQRWQCSPVTDRQYAWLTKNLTMTQLMEAAERLCGVTGTTSPDQLTRGQAAAIIEDTKRRSE